MMTTHKHNKSGLYMSLLALVASLSACAVFSPPPTHTSVEAPKQHVQVVAMVSSPEPMPVSADDIRRMAALQLRIDDFPLGGADRQRWQFELAAVENLVSRGQLAPARQRLQQLDNEVRVASHNYFQHHGGVYLQRARQFAFLSPGQSGRLRAIELAALQGQDQVVYHQGRALVRDLWSASDWVTVRQGDSLARIAARPQVYDNSRLWPLLKSANRGYFYRTNQPQAGWRLRYAVHPTLDEIFAVVEAAAP